MNRYDLFCLDGRKGSLEQGLQHEEGVEKRQKGWQANVVDPLQEHDMSNAALGKYISFQSCKCVIDRYMAS